MKTANHITEAGAFSVTQLRWLTLLALAAAAVMVLAG